MMKAKIALQLWSIQEMMQKDFFGTLKQVKDMGYDGVEFAGYGGVQAKELAEFLKTIDLKVAGSHIGFEALEHRLEEVVAFEKEIGNQRIICPYASFKTLEEWQLFFSKMNSLQKRLAEVGMTLIYHNHSHEFTEIPTVSILDEMLQTVPNVKLEVDTYWVQNAGEQVIPWLEKHRSSIALLHIKDMLIMSDGEKESTEILSGILPIRSYVEWAKLAEIPWLVVEQEAFQRLTPMESAAENIQALKTIVEEVYV